MAKTNRTILQWGELAPPKPKPKSSGNGMMMGAVVLLLVVIGFYFLRSEITGSNAAIDFIPEQTIFVSDLSRFLQLIRLF